MLDLKLRKPIGFIFVGENIFSELTRTVGKKHATRELSNPLSRTLGKTHVKFTKYFLS